MIRHNSLRKVIVWILIVYLLLFTPVFVRAEDSITIPTATSYSKVLKDNIPTTNIVIPAHTTTMEIPMKVSDGGQLQVRVGAKSLNQNVHLSILDSDGDTIEEMSTLSDEVLQCQVWIEQEEKGTIFLHIEIEESDAPITIWCRGVLYPSGNKVLNQNTWKFAGLTQSKNTAYYKVKMEKNGYIKVQGKTYKTSSGKLAIELCNRQKNSLNPKKNRLVKSNDYTTYYALKKGTYYIKIEDIKNPYKIRYKVSDPDDQGGLNKENATTLMRSKAKTDLIYLNDSKAKSGWFKFSLSSSQTLRLTISNYSTRKLEYELIAEDPNVTLHNAKFYPHNGKAIFVTSDKLPKGIYYLKVSKQSTKDASGAYSVKFE